MTEMKKSEEKVTAKEEAVKAGAKVSEKAEEVKAPAAKKAAAPKKAAAKETPKKSLLASVKKDAPAKKSKKDKNEKPGMIARAKKYLGSIRSEMKRVVWPSKKELINYSVAVIVSLIVVGVVIAALDAVISEGLVLFSGLRG